MKEYFYVLVAFDAAADAIEEAAAIESNAVAAASLVLVLLLLTALCPKLGGGVGVKFDKYDITGVDIAGAGGTDPLECAFELEPDDKFVKVDAAEPSKICFVVGLMVLYKSCKSLLRRTP
jgi:hypothetical protein